MSEAKSLTLVETLSAGVNTTVGRSCLFSTIQETLTEEERSALDTAIDNIVADKNTGQRKAFSVAWLVGVLSSQGHSISASTLRRHVMRGCVCFSGSGNGSGIS